MKVVLNLWDGVRYDAIFKAHEWLGLPNFFRVVKNGVFFNNTFTVEPSMTAECVARIMKNRRGKWIGQSLWEKMRRRSCFVGYPEESVKPYPPKIPFCDLVDCVYNRKKEAQLQKTEAGRAMMSMHRVCFPDAFRMKLACKMIPKYDFTFVYFPDTDTAAHACRDAGKHIYHYGSPYLHAIKNCDRLLGGLLNTLDRVAPYDYIVIIIADHGMTDEGRHSVGRWTDSEVMHVPLAMMGKGIRTDWQERELHYTYEVTSGIVGLFKGDAHKTMFKYALNKHA